MKSLEFIKQYFTITKIKRFFANTDVYSWEIRYKHYLRFPKISLKRKLTCNTKESEIFLKLVRKRRSIRHFSKQKQVTYEQLNYILISSFGTTYHDPLYRAYPSAGALYPIEVYILLTRSMDSISSGIYHLNFLFNHLEKIADVPNEETAKYIFGKNCFENTQAFIILTGIPTRFVKKYGIRGMGYMYIEVGHMAQNVYLSVITQRLKCCTIGGFLDSELCFLLKLREEYEFPLYVIAIGT